MEDLQCGTVVGIMGEEVACLAHMLVRRAGRVSTSIIVVVLAMRRIRSRAGAVQDHLLDGVVAEIVTTGKRFWWRVLVHGRDL
jgi:hypothetical protein